MRRRVLIALLLLAAACSAREPVRGPEVVVSSGQRRLHVRVEIADSAGERQQGLMNRPSIPPGTGMLFVYPSPARWGGIWMKDTLVPLDVAFAADGTIVAIFTLEPCRTDPCPTSEPQVPYDRVLEVPAGTLAGAGLGVGARIELVQ